MSEPDYQPRDLFGNPVHPRKGERGRPQHVPTDETWEVVIGLWAKGETNEYCARALRISDPTFRENYFRTNAHKAVKHQSRAHVEGLVMAATLKGVREGNMAAVKTLQGLCHKADMERLSKQIAKGREEDEADEEETAPAKKLGKKDQLAAEAAKITGPFAPPSMSDAKH